MTTEIFVLDEYRWAITILIDCDCNDYPEIQNRLESINCPYSLQNEIKQSVLECKNNTGFTYSNYYLKRSVMVISKTDNIKQMINTISHECYHFICLLKEANYIDNEEKLADLTGRFNMNCWDIIQDKIIG